LELFLKIAKAHKAPTISHHIKELAQTELIITEKRGGFLICRVNEQLVTEVSKMLALQNSLK